MNLIAYSCVICPLNSFWSFSSHDLSLEINLLGLLEIEGRGTEQIGIHSNEASKLSDEEGIRGEKLLFIFVRRH